MEIIFKNRGLAASIPPLYTRFSMLEVETFLPGRELLLRTMRRVPLDGLAKV